MTLVKICGITNLEDAVNAVESGADFLGFNFYAGSPRYIKPSAARTIIDQLPQSVVTVGVFVNEQLERILEIAAEAGVLMLQLHGDESPEYCATLSGKGRNVIKAFNTRNEFSLDVVKQYYVPLILIDAAAPDARGGTGMLSDWSVARSARKAFLLVFLAGGLSAENVASAIAAVEPYAVDACSALEQSPGKKDHEKVRQFVAAVRAVSPHPFDLLGID